MENQPGSRIAGESGFTLAELLTAIVVIGVGIFGTMQLFLGSLHATSATTARSRAVGIATHEVDILRGVPWAALGFDPAIAPADPPEGPTVTVDPAVAAVQPTGPDQSVAGVSYHVDRGVVWAAVGADEQAEKRVLVTVTWHDETGDHIVGQDGLVAPGAGVTAATTSAVTPGAPTGVSATTDAGHPDTRINLFWSGGAASTWEIQRALDPTFAAAVVDTVTLPGATTAFLKPGLSPGTTYWFRIRGRAGSATSSWSPPASVTTAGALTGPCRVGAMNLGGSPATVDLADGRLGGSVTVEIEAQGGCAALAVVTAPDGVNFVSRPMTLAGGGVWQATIEADLAPIRWATGAHEVDVLDAGASTLARGAVVVCTSSGPCPS